MRFVADTNVIVSALVCGGVPRRVLELAEGRICRLSYSAAIEREVRGVLRDKFGWDEAVLGRVLGRLWSIGDLVVPRGRVNAVRDDPDDSRILECALAAKADFVVSGDRHLLRLRAYGIIPIVTPREFVEIFPRRG